MRGVEDETDIVETWRDETTRAYAAFTILVIEGVLQWEGCEEEADGGYEEFQFGRVSCAGVLVFDVVVDQVFDVFHDLRVAFVGVYGHAGDVWTGGGVDCGWLGVQDKGDGEEAFDPFYLGGGVRLCFYLWRDGGLGRWLTSWSRRCV